MPTPDSRRIIRHPQRDHTGENDHIPRRISPPAIATDTRRVVVDTGGPDDPRPILPEEAKRRGAVLYVPATDPHPDANPDQATVWIGPDGGDPLEFYPLEPGGSYVHESRAWLLAWTAAGDAGAVYVALERD